MSQFAIYPMPGRLGGFVVNVQSSLLDSIATRVVIPLVPRAAAPTGLVRHLNPVLSIGENPYVLMTQNMASIPLGQLRDSVGSVAFQRDAIVRAIDTLLTGV